MASLCKSGKHYWLDETSARKCCNGWRRVLVVPHPSVPKESQPVADSPVDLDGVRCAFGWIPESIPTD